MRCPRLRGSKGTRGRPAASDLSGGNFMARPLARSLCGAALAASGALAVLVGGSVPASAATYVVGTVDTGGTSLNVRAGASASSTIVGSVPDGGTGGLGFQVRGQSV